jgi:hypothetical protein
MKVNLKKHTTKLDPLKYHRSYGIQNWLLSKGFCASSKFKIDEYLYTELLQDFILYDNPNFDFNKPINMDKYEKYIQDRWVNFCNFCVKKFRT